MYLSFIRLKRIPTTSCRPEWIHRNGRVSHLSSTFRFLFPLIRCMDQTSPDQDMRLLIYFSISKITGGSESVGDAMGIFLKTGSPLSHNFITEASMPYTFLKQANPTMGEYRKCLKKISIYTIQLGGKGIKLQ